MLYSYDKEKENEYNCRVVGTDEAGRGPLAGPVVAAAVMLDLDDTIDEINDSKKLTAKKRDKLYDIILERVVSWKAVEISPAEIDEINILQASLKAMRESVEACEGWSLVLVDGNQYIPQIDHKKQLPVVKGDGTSASIAAASIIAKVTRDRIMEKYHDEYPQYDFASHKGYPTVKHREAVKKYGLSPIHRKSFCRNIISQIELPL